MFWPFHEGQCSMELVKGMNTFVNDFLYVVEMKIKLMIKAAELETIVLAIVLTSL